MMTFSRLLSAGGMMLRHGTTGCRPIQRSAVEMRHAIRDPCFTTRCIGEDSDGC